MKRLILSWKNWRRIPHKPSADPATIPDLEDTGTRVALDALQEIDFLLDQHFEQERLRQSEGPGASDAPEDPAK